MIRCFLIPMTDPPYSRENPQRPKYLHELRITWTGSPLIKKGLYVVKASAPVEKLNELQAREGVIDFPNVFTDDTDDLPTARKQKNDLLLGRLNIENRPFESVLDLINRSARCEGNYGWDASKLYVPEDN